MSKDHNLIVRLQERKLGVEECPAYIVDAEEKPLRFICFINGFECKYESGSRQECPYYRTMKERERGK